MSGFALPTHNRKNESSFELLPLGEYDVSLKESQYKEAGSTGNPMMIFKVVVDNGQHQGADIEEMFYFGHEKGIGEGRLQGLANRARKTDGSLDPTVDANGVLLFVTADGKGQTTDPELAKKDADGEPDPVNAGGFVFSSDFNSLDNPWEGFFGQFVQTPALRFRVKTRYEYDIKDADDNWERRVPKKRFENHVAAGGQGSTKVKFRVIAPPKEAPTLVVDTQPDQEQSQFPASGDGQAFPGTEEPAVMPAATTEAAAVPPANGSDGAPF